MKGAQQSTKIHFTHHSSAPISEGITSPLRGLMIARMILSDRMTRRQMALNAHGFLHALVLQVHMEVSIIHRWVMILLKVSLVNTGCYRWHIRHPRNLRHHPGAS